MPTSAPVNIQELLGADFETHMHLFGNLVESEPSEMFTQNIAVTRHSFRASSDVLDSSHVVGTADVWEIIVEELNGQIVSINVFQIWRSPILQPVNLSLFHFNSIEIGSTVEDVTSVFGTDTGTWSETASIFQYVNNDFGVGTQGVYRRVALFFNNSGGLGRTVDAIKTHIFFGQ